MKLSLGPLGLVVLASLLACNNGIDGGPGANGKDGQPGAPGATPEPTDGEQALSLVTPSKGILDREVEVSIGGNGTKFEEGAKPSFGPGIEVIEVTTSSTSLITAKIRIAKDAPVGSRTVTIGTLKAEHAFNVIAAINVVSGSKDGAEVLQGGLVQFKIENNDTRAFDSNAFSLEAADLIDLGSQASGPQSATGFLLAPPLAKTGKAQVSVMNMGPDGKPSISFLSAADALGVTPRSAAAFTLDQGTEESFGSSTETKLFKLSSPASEASIVDYRIEVGATDGAVPVAFVFGTGGTKDDRLGQVLPGQNPFTGEFVPAPYDLHVALPISGGAGATDHYVVLANLGGTANAKAKITASRAAAAVANESATPHTAAAPQVVGAVTSDLGQVVNANLGGASEVDVYKLTVDAAAKLQIVVSSDPDLEVILTKDPNVLEDAQGTPAGNKKVLAALYPGKQFAAQKALAAAVQSTEVYAVVRYDSQQGKVQSGKYTLGLRTLP